MGSFSVWHWIILFVIFGPMLLGIFVFKQAPIYLRHSVSGLPKVGRLGWSWTYLYFGWLVPIFRGEIGMGLLHLILSLVTFGLFQFIWSFLYNKQHLTRLMTTGWELDPSSHNYDTAKRRLNLNKISGDRRISPQSFQPFGGDTEETVVVSDVGRWVMAGFDANGNVIRLAFSQSNPKLSQEGLIIGRDSKSCDLCINDQSVSRRHAKLSKRGENILIEDLNSTNGIQINGKPLKTGSSSDLPSEGEMQIGAVNLSLGRH
jgi:hypothetical protein